MNSKKDFSANQESKHFPLTKKEITKHRRRKLYFLLWHYLCVLSCSLLLSSLFEVTVELLFNKLFDRSLNNKRTTVALKRSQYKKCIRKLLESREFYNQINNVTADTQRYKMIFFCSLHCLVYEESNKQDSCSWDSLYILCIERNQMIQKLYWIVSGNGFSELYISDVMLIFLILQISVMCNLKFLQKMDTQTHT